MKKQKLRTVGYIRVSTKKQEQYGGSIDAQHDMIQKYCEMYDLELVGCLQDASSAKAIKSRPAMLELLELCRGGSVDAFVTCKIDRMFRNTIEGLQTADEFEKLGVSMFFIEMGGTSADVTTARGRRIFAYELIDAECERMRTGERTKAVLRHKRETGDQHAAHAPFGWHFLHGKTFPHEQEQQALKLIWQSSHEGMGLTAITNALSASKHKTRGGKMIWAPSTIRATLDNPINHDLFKKWERENAREDNDD